VSATSSSSDATNTAVSLASSGPSPLPSWLAAYRHVHSAICNAVTAERRRSAARAALEVTAPILPR